MNNNPYVKYYVAQQTGQGMPVFKGGSWQRGYGGLGGFLRGLGRKAYNAF